MSDECERLDEAATSDPPKSKKGDILPDVVEFRSRAGGGKMIRLLNGNTVELWQGEQDEDWMFVFRNAVHDRLTSLRLSGEAAWVVCALLWERVREGTLPMPPFPDTKPKEARAATILEAPRG